MKLLFISIFTLFSLIPQQKEPILKQFGEEYKKAILFIKENKVLIKKTLNSKSNREKEMLASCFPELLRYNLIKNLIETQLLKIGYIKWGKKAADFSIGTFQIKPSFAENLEEYTKKHLKNDIITKKIAYPTQNNDSLNRIIRIERLETLEGQLTYINAFKSCVEHKYQIQNLPTEEYIQFLSTAYNRGFGKTVDEYKKWMKIKSFPYGRKYGEEGQFNFSNISLFFFNREGKNILKTNS